MLLDMCSPVHRKWLIPMHPDKEPPAHPAAKPSPLCPTFWSNCMDMATYEISKISLDFKNSTTKTCFQAILSNFLPQHYHQHQKWDDIRIDLIQIWTGKTSFSNFCSILDSNFCSNFFLQICFSFLTKSVPTRTEVIQIQNHLNQNAW